jgi:aminoglycoside/choline kinase family phosphotransferase
VADPLPVSSRDAEIEHFLAAVGWARAQRQALGADWSNRRYERIRLAGTSAILMDAAGDAPVGAFVAVDRWLRGIGLHAPELLGIDEPEGLLLLEDLGDALLARVVAEGGDELALYHLALDAILHFQDAEPPAFLPVLDEAGLLGLLDLYLDFATPLLPAEARAEFAGLWQGLLQQACHGAGVFLYRDYHAENLLWLPHEHGLWRLGLLDFQDAFKGPAAYDLVSLIQDARRDVAPEVAAAVVQRYLAARPAFDPESLAIAMAVLGAQRAMRILGVIARLTTTKGRTFPPGMKERVSGYLVAALAHPALAELRCWCERHGTLTLKGP